MKAAALVTTSERQTGQEDDICSLQSSHKDTWPHGRNIISLGL